MALKTVINGGAVAVSAFTLMVVSVLILASMTNAVAGERPLIEKEPELVVDREMGRQGVLGRVISFFWQSGKSSYEPVWPVSVRIFFSLFTFSHLVASNMLTPLHIYVKWNVF